MLSAIGMEELVVTMMHLDGMIIVLFVHVLTQMLIQLPLKVQPPKVQPLNHQLVVVLLNGQMTKFVMMKTIMLAATGLVEHVAIV